MKIHQTCYSIGTVWFIDSVLYA